LVYTEHLSLEKFLRTPGGSPNVCSEISCTTKKGLPVPVRDEKAVVPPLLEKNSRTPGLAGSMEKPDFSLH